jgi:hypothetical protein
MMAILANVAKSVKTLPQLAPLPSIPGRTGEVGVIVILVRALYIYRLDACNAGHFNSEYDRVLQPRALTEESARNVGRMLVHKGPSPFIEDWRDM